MDTKNLLEQWNERMVYGNKLSREIEDFENILDEAKNEASKICVSRVGVGSTYFDSILDEKVMVILKEIVINTLKEGRDNKITELEKMIGKKEDNIVISEKSVIKKSESVIEPIENVTKPELTVELVKSLYHEQDMKLDDVAEEVGVPRTTLYNFIVKNNLKKPSKREQKIFRDTEVQAKKPS